MTLSLTRFFSSLCTIAIWAIPAVHSVGNAVVDLGYAKYLGIFNTTSQTTQFLGMRYAAPPTGNLRWRAPQSPAHVKGIQYATKEPPTCFMAWAGGAPKTHIANPEDFVPSEDCLFLNVYAPGKLTDRRKLPVVVWIHGGGYMSGSASGYLGVDIYDGVDLIRASNNGAVIVIIQYRLGLFGFLSGSNVKKGGSLNAGLLDQQFALQWVQQHIEKFRGDPKRVTIWGESAGAGSVLQHIVANDGKTAPPLFHAAITSSTYLPSQYQYNDTIPENLYNTVVQKSKCSNANDTLKCLRTVDAKTLEQVNLQIGASAFYGTFAFVPVVDGVFIKQRPTEALKKRKVNGNALLSVTNTFEGAIFVDPKTRANADVGSYVRQLFPKFGPRQAKAVAEQYRGLGDGLSQRIAVMGEAIFICPTYYLLMAFGGRGFKAEFAVPRGGHADDVVYYFPSTLATGPPYNNTDFVKAFSHSFLNFATSLDPNVKSSPDITARWNRWNGEVEMVFNRTASGKPDIHVTKTSPGLLKRCDFWESVGALSGQ